MNRRYVEITVRGNVTSLLAVDLEDVAVVADGDVTRVLGVMRDASALHGILDRLNALGVVLLALKLYERPPT